MDCLHFHPPPRRNTKPIPLDPSPLKFPLRNSWGHGRLQIASKQLYPFKTMLICIVCGGQHHLLQLAPPPTTKDLKDFTGLFLLFVCFWEGNAVKHGEIVGKQLYFFKPMLICIVSWCQHHLLQLAPPPPQKI